MHSPLLPTQLCSIEVKGSTEKCMNCDNPPARSILSCAAEGAGSAPLATTAAAAPAATASPRSSGCVDGMVGPTA